MEESTSLSDWCSGNYLSKSDSEVFKSIKSEYNRQRENIELIASENYVSTAVLEAAGSMAYQQICRRVSGTQILRRV